MNTSPQQPTLPAGYSRCADPFDPANAAHAVFILCALIHDCLIYVAISLEIVNSSHVEITAKYFEHRGDLLTSCLVLAEPQDLASAQSASNSVRRGDPGDREPIASSFEGIIAEGHEVEKLCASLRRDLIQGLVTRVKLQEDVKDLTHWLFLISAACLNLPVISPPPLRAQVELTLHGLLRQYGFRFDNTEASKRSAFLSTDLARKMALNMRRRLQIPSTAIPPPVRPSGPWVALTVSLELALIMDILHGLCILEEEAIQHVRFGPPSLRSQDLSLFDKLYTPDGDLSLYGAHVHAARDVVCRIMPGPSRVTFKRALQYIVRPLLDDDMFPTGPFYTEFRELGVQMQIRLDAMCQERCTALSVFNYVQSIQRQISATGD
ncbi:hypothetical protein BDZ89DRAFT_1118401 [Hymenopellis radicata]|nr:hypothetical protein BDZ89DRAFT_1118401 [Hymenopellis radicata]